MKVFGIGNDIVPVDRFKKLALQDEQILLKRMFTTEEQTHLLSLRSTRLRTRAYAASFAIKESIYKALGTGLINGMSWKDIEVQDLFQTCRVTLHGRTNELFNHEQITAWRVTCSATTDLAIAFAVLFSKDK